jgi:hypothetical protein
VTKLDLWKDATLIFCNSTCFSDSVSLDKINLNCEIIMEFFFQLIQAISTVAGLAYF